MNDPLMHDSLKKEMIQGTGVKAGNGMKRRRFLPPALLLSLCMLISACASSGAAADRGPSDAFDPQDFTPSPAPSDYVMPGGRSYHYVRNRTVSADRIPLTCIDLPDPCLFVLPTADGGCLALSQTSPAESDNADPSAAVLRAVRFRGDGSIAWDCRYSAIPFSGFIVSACVWQDGSFAAALRVKKNGSDIFSDTFCRFSANGNMISRINGIEAGSLDRLFACTGGTALAAGTIEKKGKTEAVLTRIEQNGSRKAVSADSANVLILEDASYAAKTGIVLIYAKDANTAALPSAYVVRCFDENLKERWTKEMPRGNTLSEVFLPDGTGMLSAGTVPKSGTTESLPALFHFDANGTLDWTYTAQTGRICAAAGLSDGRYALAVSDWSGGAETTILSILSPKGELLAQTNALHGYAEQLVSTADGGFTAVLRQDVRAIPQPPQISSIWTDTEAIVLHCDKGLFIEWMRTVDQYKHERRTDILVPTSNGKLLAG